ncbi:ANTAR domain-containing protein [Humibacillus xanthopallidus]
MEQAKGVLAHQNTITVEDAYATLRERAVREGTTLTETAKNIVRDAHRK